MCGIAGIVQPGKIPIDESIPGKILTVLSHRGPDGSGQWRDLSNQVMLLHRRLSVIDLSENARQPLHYLDRYMIIHNGEIYNYIELKDELKKAGYQFRTESDTEVIAAAYDRWKERCLDHFDGMFAFALWDEHEKKFFAARDRFGERPFFYHFDGVRLTFASEMKALWAAGIPRIPNQRLVFNFLTIGYTSNPDRPDETFFENIKKLPPAHSLSFAPGGSPAVNCYWQLETNAINKDISDEVAIEKFRELFQCSVKRRLRSDVSLGCNLSGGLDSSAVLSMMVGLSGEAASSLNAFTAVFPGFEKDEAAFARQVATEKKVEHHAVEVNMSAFEDDWGKMMHYQEEPAGSSSIYPQYKLFGLAKEKGVKVLVDGQGADEVLAGYTKYYKWYWQELFRRGKLLRSGEIPAARKIGVDEKFGPRNLVAALFPDMASVVLERRYLLQAIRHPDLSETFTKQQSREAYYTTPPVFTLNGALHFNTCIYGLEELLRYADRNAMAHGREVRLPFLSHELVEFLFSLPPSFKIRKGWTKWLLRETMKNELPGPIVWRKEKIGFEPPQRSWMQEPLVQSMIGKAKALLVQNGILKKEVLEKDVEPLPAHHPRNYDWRYLSAATIFK